MSALEPNANPGCAAGCPRHALGARLLTLAGWLAAALAALSVAAVPFDFGEALCGPWGCLPPLPALVAMHLLWFVAAGALVRATAGLSLASRRVVGSVLIGAALAAAALVIGTDLYDWFGRGSELAREYWPQRVAFKLATATDVPVFQLLVAGTARLVLDRRACARARNQPGMM